MTCRIVSLGFALLLVFTSRSDVRVNWEKSFGGTGTENTARAIAADLQGNWYVAGGTTSTDFPTTPGVEQSQLTQGGQSTGSFGAMDVFISKFSPSGECLWSRLLGGPNYDRAYSVRVGPNRKVYLAGRAGEGFPTTKGVVQPIFEGDDSGNRAYGKQDGFIACLNPEQGQLEWATYFGTPGKSIIRDLALDSEGILYVTLIESTEPMRHITAGAVQTRKPGAQDSIVASLSADGRQLRWCTYLGGSGRDLATSIQVDGQGRVFLAGSTNSPDFPDTESGFTAGPGGKEDAFLVCLSNGGDRQLFGVRLGGGEGDGVTGKHGLAVDVSGKAYLTGFTHSPDFPTTSGAFQSAYHGGSRGPWEDQGDRFVAVVSSDGQRLEACTLVGGNRRDGGEGITVDDQGRVYLSGFSFSTDHPVSPDALQPRHGGVPSRKGDYTGGGDALLIVLSPGLDRLEFSSFLGREGDEALRAIAVSMDGRIGVAGKTTSKAWPPVSWAKGPMRPTVGRETVVVMELELSFP